MPYCPKCGSMLEEGDAFCCICGAPVRQPQPKVEAQPQTETQAPQAEARPVQYAPPQYTPRQQPAQPKAAPRAEAVSPDAQDDIENNKIYAALSYFGPLVLVPIFASPKSKFARFHANQGLLLCCVYGAVILISILLSLIKVDRISIFGFYTRVVPWYVVLIIVLLWLPVIGLAVLGAINGGTGKYKKLPLIGDLFTILK